MKKSIVLLSGGLDSATTLYYAQSKGYQTTCVVFHYGQRHSKEILSAKRLAQRTNSPYQLLKIAFPWKGSSLTDKKMKVPHRKEVSKIEIPSTYVPGRNIIFLSFAASYAEVIGARTIFIGANAIDYSGYPDCRPEFLAAFGKMLRKGLKTGVQGGQISIKAPLLRKSKAQIIRMGTQLHVPYELTWSCYQGGKLPCEKCDSCQLRQKGFEEAGVQDPLRKGN